MRFFYKIFLRIYIKLHNYSYGKINNISVKLGNGIHPKHRIMKYYQYFVDNIEKDSKVLDIGCGIGHISFKVSQKAREVIGIDINKKLLSYAIKNFDQENIKYINADIMKYEFREKFDYIILSNVLEHIKERKKLLNQIKTISKYLLIRVPMINRSWLPLYKKQLGYEYLLDRTHYIEYTFDSLKFELETVGLRIISYKINYGEIWAKISTS